MTANSDLMRVLRDSPRLSGAITRMRMASEQLADEMLNIDEYADGAWFDGMSAECDRRRAVAYHQFGAAVVESVRMVMEAAGTEDERRALDAERRILSEHSEHERRVVEEVEG